METASLIKNIAILANPLSGKGKAVKTGEWLDKQLTQRHIAHQLFPGKWPGSLSAFSEIWIAGGDGTINYFLNHYNCFHLPLVLFKGGTGNDFAWMLYGDICLEQQLEIALNTEARQVDAASCNGQFYVNSCGIGFDGEVLRSINSIRWLGGHLGYLAVVIRKIFSFKEFMFRIITAGKNREGRYLLVIVNNSMRTGGGFLVTPDASVTDGLLDLMLCDKLPVLKRYMYLPVIEKGKHLHLNFIHYSKESFVNIESTIPVYAQLDGELIRAKCFNIKIHPAMLLIKY